MSDSKIDCKQLEQLRDSLEAMARNSDDFFDGNASENLRLRQNVLVVFCEIRDIIMIKRTLEERHGYPYHTSAAQANEHL